MGFGKVLALSVVALGVLIGFLIFEQRRPPANSATPQKVSAPAPATLMVYVSAGLQPPAAEILAAYEASHSVTLQTKFAGSGSLLSDVLMGGGDVFLSADRMYLTEAEDRRLVSGVEPIAYQVPVIVVRKGNPRRITGLKELQKPDVRLSLADPKRAAIGKVVSELLVKDEQWETLWKKAVIQRETVNEVANDVKLSAADAGIVWDATVKQYPDLEVVHVPEFDRSKNEIAVGVLSSSKDPLAARELIRYIVDPDQGLKAFAKHGYAVVQSKQPGAPEASKATESPKSR
jgi:molybdate transport system substrate-binding protein